MALDAQARNAIIRKGNEFFNAGKMIDAYRCFNTANYIAGIEKLADYYWFEKRDPLLALAYYKRVKNERTKSKTEDAYRDIAKIIQRWLKEDSEEMETETKNAATQKTEKQKRNGFQSRIGRPHFYSKE